MDGDARARSHKTAPRAGGPVASVPAVTDEDLMARFQAGSASAFDDLVDRHKRPLFAYLNRSLRNPADADDVFQDVFAKVIRAAPGWENSASFKTWLYTIARNALIDAARRRKTHPKTSAIVRDGEDGISEDLLASPAPSAVTLLVHGEVAEAIEGMVQELPAEQREAFLLKREGLTFEEIGEVTGTPRNTVKSRLRYALDKVRQGLRERGLLGGDGERS